MHIPKKVLISRLIYKFLFLLFFYKRDITSGFFDNKFNFGVGAKIFSKRLKTPATRLLFSNKNYSNVTTPCNLRNRPENSEKKKFDKLSKLVRAAKK